jgi:hypothetical protein
MLKSACLALFVILIAGCGSGQAQFGHGHRFGGFAPHYQFYRGYGSGFRGYSPYYHASRGYGGYRGYSPSYRVARAYGPSPPRPGGRPPPGRYRRGQLTGGHPPAAPSLTPGHAGGPPGTGGPGYSNVGYGYGPADSGNRGYGYEAAYEGHNQNYAQGGYRYSCRIKKTGDSCTVYTSTSKGVGASCKCHKQPGFIE